MIKSWPSILKLNNVIVGELAPLLSHLTLEFMPLTE